MDIREKVAANPLDGTDLVLSELGIVVVASTNNPTILNVDFLRHNGIVDCEYVVRDPLISTPAFSQVLFENGLSITSTPSNLTFKWDAVNGILEQSECERLVNVASLYLQQLPHVPYRAIGINPRCLRRESDENLINSFLSDGGDWSAYKDVAPEIQLKAIYHYEGRTINLDIIRTHKLEDQSCQTTFIANFHRDLPDSDATDRIKVLSTILGNWRDDLCDLRNLTNKFQ